MAGLVEWAVRLLAALVAAFVSIAIAWNAGVEYGIAFCAAIASIALWGPLDAEKRAKNRNKDAVDDGTSVGLDLGDYERR